jgi:hypothetical protein
MPSTLHVEKAKRTTAATEVLALDFSGNNTIGFLNSALARSNPGAIHVSHLMYDFTEGDWLAPKDGGKGSHAYKDVPDFMAQTGKKPAVIVLYAPRFYQTHDFSAKTQDQIVESVYTAYKSLSPKPHLIILEPDMEIGSNNHGYTLDAIDQIKKVTKAPTATCRQYDGTHTASAALGTMIADLGGRGR